MKTTLDTTQSFDRWWRDEGQFLQPAATANPEQLEYLRSYANSVYSVISDLQNSVKVAELDTENAEDDLRELREAITEALDSTDDTESKLKAIKEALE